MEIKSNIWKRENRIREHIKFRFYTNSIVLNQITFTSITNNGNCN